MLKQFLKEEIDHSARELYLYADNDGDLYRQRLIPIYKNLEKKKKKGVYDSTLAVKAFMYAIDEAAKKYVKEFGSPGDKWNIVFPKNVREIVAKEYVDYFENEISAGNSWIGESINESGNSIKVRKGSGSDNEIMISGDKEFVSSNYRKIKSKLGTIPFASETLDSNNVKIYNIRKPVSELQKFVDELDESLTEKSNVRFEVVPAKRWKNKSTGETASVTGSVPYTSDADKKNWSVETVGYTVKDNKTGTTGMGRKPFDTEKEANEFINNLPSVKKNGNKLYNENVSEGSNIKSLDGMSYEDAKVLRTGDRIKFKGEDGVETVDIVYDVFNTRYQDKPAIEIETKKTEQTFYVVKESITEARMTPAQLKYEYQEANPEGHYFDKATMKFFGDTMGNYGVRDKGEAWELYRKRPVKHGLQDSAYFDKKTFKKLSRHKFEEAKDKGRLDINIDDKDIKVRKKFSTPTRAIPNKKKEYKRNKRVDY